MAYNSTLFWSWSSPASVRGNYFGMIGQNPSVCKPNPMIRESRQLVTDKPVNLKNNWLEFKTA